MITNKKPFLYFNLLASFFNFDFRNFFYDCEEIFIVAKKFSYSCREFFFFFYRCKKISFFLWGKFFYSYIEIFFIFARKIFFKKSVPIRSMCLKNICKEKFYYKSVPDRSMRINFFFKVQKKFFLLI